MAQNDANAELDAELAALFEPVAPVAAIPDLDDLLGTGDSRPNASLFDDAENTADAKATEVDLGAVGFPEITKRFADVAAKVFDEPVVYYKEVISNEGEAAQRMHAVLQKYLNTKDPKDKSVLRQQLIPVVWEFLRSVVRKAAGKLSDPKKYLLRFGILHPSFLDAPNKELFAKILMDNTYDQPVYYLDEWFKAVGSGAVRNSASDEAKVARGNANAQQKQFLEKAEGKLQGIRNLLKGKAAERINLESSLQRAIGKILEHSHSSKMQDVSECYTTVQRLSFSEVQDILKNLLGLDRETATLFKELANAEYEVGSLKRKVEAEEVAVDVDVKAVDTEFESIRQMTKMNIGRQGNHFPVLSKDYFHCGPNDTATRENIIAQLAWVESIDAEVFCRYYRNKQIRIVPYVILLPNYGDTGVCWEPFERFNRATSRGRIAIPMYPKSLQEAVLAGVADLRWQVAKEKASYYWMEEGLTGFYYQWFTGKKLKGDVKEAFVEDYISWILKESEGSMKLDKELRGVFWRYIPFAQPIKEKLKARNFIYQELYQRDLNRAMSDGY